MSIKDVKQLGARLSNGAKTKPGIDAASIRELAELLTETGLTEIEVEQGGMRLRVARQVAPVFAHPPASPGTPIVTGVSTPGSGAPGGVEPPKRESTRLNSSHGYS